MMPPIATPNENNNKLFDKHFRFLHFQNHNRSKWTAPSRSRQFTHDWSDWREISGISWTTTTIKKNKDSEQFLLRKCRHSNDIVCAVSWQSTLPQCLSLLSFWYTIHIVRLTFAVNASSSLIPFSLALEQPIRHCHGSCLTRLACCIFELCRCGLHSAFYRLFIAFETNIQHRITSIRYELNEIEK